MHVARRHRVAHPRPYYRGEYVLVFDGTNNVAINTSHGPLGTSDPWAVSWWWRCDLSSRVIWSCDDGTLSNRLQAAIEGTGKLRVTLIIGGTTLATVTGTTVVTDSVWRHGALSCTAGPGARTLKMYVGATQEGGDQTFTDALAALTQWRIGAAGDGTVPLRGRVARLGIYRGAQDSRVAAWNGTAKGQWHLDPGVRHAWLLGDAANDGAAAGAVLRDVIGGCNLTPTNMVAGDLVTGDHPT